MNYLFVSPFFFPEIISTGKWNTYFVKELSKFGVIDVFCMHPLYPDWKVVKSTEQLAGVDMTRVGGCIKFPGSPTLRRAVLEVYFLLALVWFVLSRGYSKRYEKIFIVIPPSLFAVVLAGFFRKRVVVIVHDLQSVHMKASGGKINNIVARIVDGVESFCFSLSSKLIFLSNEMKSYVADRVAGVDEKAVVSYPFVTIDRFDNLGDLDALFGDKYKDFIHIVYSGALGDKQNPVGLINIFQEIVSRRKDVVVTIFSQGKEFDGLKSGYSGFSDRLRFDGLVPESCLPELLLRSDIQIIPQAAGTSAGSLPSKLPNVLASPAYLFCITDEGSELESIISNCEGVYVSNSWELEKNVDMLVEVVAERLKGSQGYNRGELLKKFRLDELVKESIR